MQAPGQANALAITPFVGRLPTGRGLITQGCLYIPMAHLAALSHNAVRADQVKELTPA